MEGSGGSWRDAYKGMSSDNIKGLVLALSSSLFIGASFIVKKKGLKRAGASGLRAGSGGYSYLLEPLWWVGMITMIVGEIANFAAYAFAPAILVTPLGALSIIISAVLAHVMLRKKLHTFGILGCALCVVGSITIVLHAPQEQEIDSVLQVWNLATEPAFLLYAAAVVGIVIILILQFIPQYGQSHVMVYIGVCSLVGSLSVMSIKALGITLKLTFSGMNQLIYPQTWVFTLIVLTCVITQMNYLNKALDTFNTAVVSPIYYVMFTSLTILASVIMFKDWDRQDGTQIVTELCGFVQSFQEPFCFTKQRTWLMVLRPWEIWLFVFLNIWKIVMGLSKKGSHSLLDARSVPSRRGQCVTSFYRKTVLKLCRERESRISICIPRSSIRRREERRREMIVTSCIEIFSHIHFVLLFLGFGI